MSRLPGILLLCVLLSGCGEKRTELSGRISYQDRLYAGTGFTGVEAKPVRFALVDLLDSSGERLYTTVSDGEGRYRFYETIPYRFSLRVLSQDAAGGQARISVQDLGGDVYAVKKDIEGFERVVDISLPESVSAPFNIFDVYQAAREYFFQLTGQQAVPLNVFWQAGNLDGTYYCTAYANPGCIGGAGIYVLSEQDSFGSMYDDRDEYDDDVLLHEYAHFLFAHYSRDDSPGGCHSLEANNQDLTLAWSEGWGNFFPAAVKTWMQASGSTALSSQAAASLYVDTMISSLSGQDIAGISFDFAQPDQYPGATDQYFYAGSEVAMANILWKLHQQQNGMAGLWRIFSSTAWKTQLSWTNAESFWDALLNPDLGHGYSEAGVVDFFLDRGIRYQPDAYEPDNNASSLRLLTPAMAESHTLYRDDGVADEDVFALQASAGVTYVIVTENLKNGADTQLWLYDDASLANLLMVNDDLAATGHQVGDATCGLRLGTSDALGSKIEFTPPQSGLYYIKVATASEPYGFTGRYGGYDIRVSASP